MYAQAKHLDGITTVVRIEDVQPLFQITDDKFYQEIKESIQKDGLLYPIVVVRTSLKDWTDLYNTYMKTESNSKWQAFPPNMELFKEEGTRVLCIATGHNRLQALKELGYSLVDASIVETRGEGLSLGAAYRHLWALYGTHVRGRHARV